MSPLLVVNLCSVGRMLTFLLVSPISRPTVTAFDLVNGSLSVPWINCPLRLSVVVVK